MVQVARISPVVRWTTVAVVSNTHDMNLVQSHLGAMGAENLVASVTTSIEVGVRKPHRAYLIDPGRTTQVPEPRRIDSLFTLVSHLDGAPAGP